VLEETDANLVAVEPDALAAPVRVAGCGQHQEELAQVDVVDRAPNPQLGAGIGHVADPAIARPGSIDRHHLRGIAAPELDARHVAAFADHRLGSPDRPAVPFAAMVNGTPQQGITAFPPRLSGRHGGATGNTFLIPVAAHFPGTTPRAGRVPDARASAADSS